MNNGKYQANRPVRRKSWKTALPLILALLVLTISAGGTVTNTSNIKAYVRAAMVDNWMDNGIYYYNGELDPNGVTTPLTASTTDTEPNGYSFVVEIVAEAIQAEGMNATGAKDAWVKAQQPLS